MAPFFSTRKQSSRALPQTQIHNAGVLHAAHDLFQPWLRKLHANRGFTVDVKCSIVDVTAETHVSDLEWWAVSDGSGLPCHIDSALR